MDYVTNKQIIYTNLKENLIMARDKRYLQFGIMQRLYQGSGCISVIPHILENGRMETGYV